MSLPPSEIPSGAMRFNSDSQKLEYYDGAQWLQVSTFSPNLNGGARAVAMGGDGTSPVADNVIDYVTISSTGNAVSFGSLFAGAYNGSAVSSSTRGISAGGRSPGSPGSTNALQYITISSTGNATSFGNLTTLVYGQGSFSNSTRGVFCGGVATTNSPTFVDNTIEYVTIASTGNSIDFGDTTNKTQYRAGFSSPTRGVSAGGATQPTGAEQNVIDFVTISTLGNAQDFGDLTTPYWRIGACSNPIRGIIVAGESPAGDNLNNIEYVTIATLGNAVDFGDTTQTGQHSSGAASPTRGVFMGRQGGSPYPNLNIIDYVTIMTQGNAIDFGDLTGGRQGTHTCSNAHGGL